MGGSGIVLGSTGGLAARADTGSKLPMALPRETMPVLNRQGFSLSAGEESVGRGEIACRLLLEFVAFANVG